MKPAFFSLCGSLCHGDRTTVVPPDGGTVATTVTDPLDRKTELRDTGGLDGVRTSKQIIYGIVSLDAEQAGPQHPQRLRERTLVC